MWNPLIKDLWLPELLQEKEELQEQNGLGEASSIWQQQVLQKPN